MSSSSLSTDQATFIGFAVEAIAYGAYAILFSISLVVLLLKSKSEHAKLPMLFVSCYLFSLCTIHFALNFHNVYNGLLVRPRPISEETTLLEAADSIVFVTDFSAQLVLIYRCWLVWGRVYTIIILPFFMALAAFACSFGSLGLLKKIGPNLSAAPAAIIPLGTGGFAMSLCLNFIVTALIVGRIWYISRGTTRDFPWVGYSGLTKAMGVMIESGLLFLVAQFVFVVLFAIGHPAQDIAVTAALQIYGISPTLIIVRVGLGSSYEQSATRVSTMRVAHFRKRGTSPSRNTTNTFEADVDVELSSHHDGVRSIGSSEGKAILPSPTIPRSGRRHFP